MIAVFVFYFTTVYPLQSSFVTVYKMLTDPLLRSMTIGSISSCTSVASSSAASVARYGVSGEENRPEAESMPEASTSGAKIEGRAE